MISHLFHQVETKLDEWLSLTASLMAHLAGNISVVAMPKSPNCVLKHLEVIALQDTTALVVLVLHGAKVRQQLITFEQAVSQPELGAISNKLSAAYSGLTEPQISEKEMELSPIERRIVDCLTAMMRDEDEGEGETAYLNGLHFTLSQPEFARSDRMVNLVELTEQRNLLRTIVPKRLPSHGVKVVIGKENEQEIVQDYSVVVSRYGLPGEAMGSIAIVGPTRMPYARSIATVDYMASLLSRLIAKLYGKDVPPEPTWAAGEWNEPKRAEPLSEQRQPSLQGKAG